MIKIVNYLVSELLISVLILAVSLTVSQYNQDCILLCLLMAHLDYLYVKLQYFIHTVSDFFKLSMESKEAHQLIREQPHLTFLSRDFSVCAIGMFLFPLSPLRVTAPIKDLCCMRQLDALSSKRHICCICTADRQHAVGRI